MNEKISVIVPVYNAESYLSRCLDSILSQSLDGIEVICINDGSVDNSLSILRDYQREYDNLLVIDQKNAGPSAARNAGLTVAKGKYIAFVDSDDFVAQDMYQTMYSVAEENELKTVMCSYIHDYADKTSMNAVIRLPHAHILDKEDIVNLIYPEMMFDGVFNGPCNKIYLREFIQSLDTRMPEDLRYGEDLIFQLEIFDKLDRTCFLDKPFYHYVHRENSLSTAHRDMLESTLVPMYRIRQRYAAKWGISEATVAEYFVYYSLMDLINSVRHAPSGEKLRKLRQYLRNPDFSQALRKADFLKSGYTFKLKFVYIACRLLTRAAEE